VNNPHEIRFNRWIVEKLRPWLREKRGRQSQLARHLLVSRQSVHRWFIGRQVTPGWAAVATNIWFNQQLVLRSADKPIVTAESDKPVVTPQPDKLRVVDDGWLQSVLEKHQAPISVHRTGQMSDG
jgi:hypothetical protein